MSIVLKKQGLNATHEVRNPNQIKTSSEGHEVVPNADHNPSAGKDKFSWKRNVNAEYKKLLNALYSPGQTSIDISHTNHPVLLRRHLEEGGQAVFLGRDDCVEFVSSHVLHHKFAGYWEKAVLIPSLYESKELFKQEKSIGRCGRLSLYWKSYLNESLTLLREFPDSFRILKSSDVFEWGKATKSRDVFFDWIGCSHKNNLTAEEIMVGKNS